MPAASEALDMEDVEVYRSLRQQVVQFRKDASTMALRDIDLAEKSFHEALQRLLQDMTLDERLAGLTPEQRVAGLTPEQLRAALSSEQLVAALPPELARKLRD